MKEKGAYQIEPTRRRNRRTPPPSQPSLMPARGPGSTLTPMGMTSARPAVAAARTAAYHTTLATTNRGRTLAGLARGKSSANQTGTTGAASGTPSRNLRTSKRSQSPSTGVPREPGAWTCSATERKLTQSIPAARRATSNGSTSTPTKPRS